MPEVDGSIYSLSFNGVAIKVDADRGAKVRSLTVNGTEFLVSEETSSGFLWGAALWVAPQNEWGWPPLFMEIEDGPYTASINDNVMQFVSVDEYDMQFTKAFWANSVDTSIRIKYTMEYTGAGSRTNALWELVRPPVNGVTFWPTGPGGTWGDLAKWVFEDGNYSWIDIDATADDNAKFFADGADGWMAHVDANRTLFIKKWNDVAQDDFANGEGEIELWIANNYIELETLSTAKELNTGEKLNYEMIWFIRQLPESVDVEVGSESLLAYVNTVLGNVSSSVLAKHEIDVNVYPNPASEIIQLSWSLSKAETATFTLYNAIGMQVLQQNIIREQGVSLENLASGVFMYVLELNGEAVTGKIVVE